MLWYNICILYANVFRVSSDCAQAIVHHIRLLLLALRMNCFTLTTFSWQAESRMQLYRTALGLHCPILAIYSWSPTTLPQLAFISAIAASDLGLITHSNGSGCLLLNVNA